VAKPSRYVTSHPGQLSLAIPPWVGKMSTSKSWDVNRHTARCTGPVSVVSRCKLVSALVLRKQRSVSPYWPYDLGRILRLRFYMVQQIKSTSKQMEFGSVVYVIGVIFSSSAEYCSGWPLTKTLGKVGNFKVVGEKSAKMKNFWENWQKRIMKVETFGIFALYGLLFTF